MSEVANQYEVSMSQVMGLGVLMVWQDDLFYNDDFSDEVEYIEYPEVDVPTHRISDREFYEREDISGIVNDSELIPEEIYNDLRDDLEDIPDVWLDPTHSIVLALADVTCERQGLTGSYLENQFHPNNRPLGSEELSMYLNGFGYNTKPEDVEIFLEQEIRREDPHSPKSEWVTKTPNGEFELLDMDPEGYNLHMDAVLTRIIDEITVTDRWVQENEEGMDVALPTEIMQIPPDESYDLER